jgi:hypothetical protein
MFGFVESANGVQVTQTPKAILGIAVAYCGVNMLVYLGSILAALRIKPIAGEWAADHG